MVIHLLAMALWGWVVALPIGVLDLAGVTALIGLLGSIRRYPVTVRDGIVTMRLGNWRVLSFAIEQVSGVRQGWDAAALKRSDTLNLALASWPNVMLDLSPPIRLGREKSGRSHTS
jgi:hypothetical protein